MEHVRSFPPTCPKCGNPAYTAHTKYGQRHSCCGLHSWDGKPLVSPEVHKARNRCHAAFDPIWKNARIAYPDENLTTIKKLKKITRHRAYHYIAHLTGLPEPECHMSWQEDLKKLARIEDACEGVTASHVREWWKQRKVA